MKTIIKQLSALALLSVLFAGMLSATPIYMKYEGVDGSAQIEEVDRTGACSFKNVKPGNYKVYLLLPAVQKVREAAARGKGDDKHKEWIDIESWSWGASNPSSKSSGGGGTGREASTPSVSEIVVTKTMDKSSPMLTTGVSKGKTKQELNKQTTHNGDTYYQVKLTDVLISSYSVSGHGSGDPVPTESISLNFSKIEWNYKPQNVESPAVMKGSWNLKENVK